jgi:transposase InsO family protein
MKIFKNIKNIEVYKFGAISPVLYEPGIRQNEYFRKLSKKGIEIPPGSGNIYYLHVSTYKGWLKKYNESGLEGLKEKTRIDKGCHRKLTSEIIQGISQVMEKTDVVSVKDLERKLLMKNYIKSEDICYETLRKYVNDHGLLTKGVKMERKKFEKEFVNELWMVDFKEGKSIKCGRYRRRTYFCGIIDDCSRFLVGHQWGVNEDTALFARTLKRAIAIYGIPKILYCDQGKVFLSIYIVQVCARLGISLVHAQPYSAASKGKIERFNGTISRMFYPLVEDFASLSIDQLNQQFSTFVNDIYHTKVHSSLGQSPREKFQTGLSKTAIRRMDENQLEQFFLCSIKRKVRLDATVRINNIYYEVDMKYVGETVDIRFPIDQPHCFYLFENDQLVRQLKPVDLVENANPPYVATSYSKLFKK